MASLQEQLMKAGLADEKKARAIRSEKRKQRKQQPKVAAQVNEAEERARKARQEQAERDRQLNLERQKEAEKKAIQAQIRQLIETNRLDRSRGETSYQFVDGKKIKKILVDDKMVDQLSRGGVWPLSPWATTTRLSRTRWPGRLWSATRAPSSQCMTENRMTQAKTTRTRVMKSLTI